MKRFVVLVFVGVLGIVLGAHAQGLDDEYVQIFSLIQEADSLFSTAPSQALAKYLDAQTALDRLHKGSPEWNARVVNYRLTYLAEKIAALSARSPAATTSQRPSNKPPPSGAAAPQAAPPTVPTTPDLEPQLAALKDQVNQLQGDKSVLQAKIKEALAMRPAESDPRELARAEERVKALQKENDLLKVAFEKEKSAPTQDTKSLEQVQRSLDEARRQLDDQKASASKLDLEKQAVETRLKNATAQAQDATAVRAENQLLKKKLADIQATSPPLAYQMDTARQLVLAQAQIAQLQSDKESLRLQKIALETRLGQIGQTAPAASSAPAPGGAAESARIRQLELERDALQMKLESVSKGTYGRKGTGAAALVQDLENQLTIVRARLEIFEARAVPYSAEELDLLKRPETKLAEAGPKAGKKSIKELPAGSAALVAEAQSYFASKQYDKAETAYLQVLHQDAKNVPALANLAAIQVEAAHFDSADSNIKRALTIDPDDPYSLYILGILRFRQAKYDEALDALSHSAKLDPQNAEVQNYLGLALSEKGMRAPAEAALRKAIQLQPNYAGAHYNLAVVYATQQPPATELARWHYQKALAAGHPRNSDLEKRFDTKP